MFLPLYKNFQNAAFVARAFAFFADQFNVRKKLHLHRHGSISLANFAAAAGNIEREASGVVAARLRFARRREDIANVIECFDVRDGIGAWRPADGALIDEHGFRNPLHARFRRARSRAGFSAVQRRFHGFEQTFMYQRRFAGT